MRPLGDLPGQVFGGRREEKTFLLDALVVAEENPSGQLTRRQAQAPNGAASG